LIEKGLSSLGLEAQEDQDRSDASPEQGAPERMFRSLAIVFQGAKREAPDLDLNVRGPNGIPLGAALRQGDDNEAQGISDVGALSASVGFLRQMLSLGSPSLEAAAKVLADASRECPWPPPTSLQILSRERVLTILQPLGAYRWALPAYSNSSWRSLRRITFPTTCAYKP
jgi:hypothetical protein